MLVDSAIGFSLNLLGKSAKSIVADVATDSITAAPDGND
jgi:hypothetical protein